jgi:ATP-dependent Clp protease ATP-binding subunit ClpA
MTSNVGSSDIQQGGGIGFSLTHNGDSNNDTKVMRQKLLDELRRTFRPEFLNRVDDIIVFNRLAREYVGKIIELQLEDLRKRVAGKKMNVEVSAAAKELLLDEGYDEQFGARPMKRAIQRLIQDPLALKILDGEFGEGDTVLGSARPPRRSW